jgi:hypothetical protein
MQDPHIGRFADTGGFYDRLNQSVRTKLHKPLKSPGSRLRLAGFVLTIEGFTLPPVLMR